MLHKEWDENIDHLNVKCSRHKKVQKQQLYLVFKLRPVQAEDVGALNVRTVKSGERTSGAAECGSAPLSFTASTFCCNANNKSAWACNKKKKIRPKKHRSRRTQALLLLGVLIFFVMELFPS